MGGAVLIKLANLYVSLKASKLRVLLDQPMRPGNTAPLPRKLYLFWDSGYNAAPEICRYCMDSWVRMNPSWDVVKLDAESAAEIVNPREFPNDIEKAHYADILRARIMATGGGVWADATCLCLKPLDDWLPSFLSSGDFFAFSRPNVDRLIANWFLAATENSETARLFDVAVGEFWAKRRSGKVAYFWFHYLFEWLTRGSTSFCAHWAKTPKLSAVPCFMLERGLQSGCLSDEDFQLIAKTPVQKLNYKQGLELSELLEAERRIVAMQSRRWF